MAISSKRTYQDEFHCRDIIAPAQRERSVSLRKFMFSAAAFQHRPQSVDFLSAALGAAPGRHKYY